MKCEYCNNETHGGYCDCMIVDGEFRGKWWRNDPNWVKRQTESLQNKIWIYSNNNIYKE